jgi:hypothetical protein
VATKSKIQLPPTPATLPDGTIDHAPELPNPFTDLVKEPVERVRTWEEQQIERTKHLINTPDHALAAERQRQEEIEHARALAQAQAEGRSRGGSADQGRNPARVWNVFEPSFLAPHRKRVRVTLGSVSFLIVKAFPPILDGM